MPPGQPPSGPRPASPARHTGRPRPGTAGASDVSYACARRGSVFLSVAHLVLATGSGVDAIDICRRERPFAVLIGGDTGLLKMGLLARKLRESGCAESVLINVVDNDTCPSAVGFDAVMTRTFVPDAFVRAFQECYAQRFSLTADLTDFTIVRKTAMSAAQQALGMLAQSEVAVTVRPEGTRTAGDVVARVRLSMWKGAVAVDMELRCSLDVANRTAASMLSMDLAETTEEDGCSAVGELINIVAGRIQVAVAPAFGPAAFTIPQIAVEQIVAESPAQLVLRASAKDSPITFDLLMSARPVMAKTKIAA